MTLQDPLPRICVADIDPTLPVLDQAIALGRCGLRVIFVHAPIFGETREPSEQFPSATSCTCGKQSCPQKTRGKHPIANAWQKVATHEEQSLRDQYSRLRIDNPNLGIAFGEQPSGAYVVAIDIDDEPRYQALVKELGELPETARCDSGRGYRLLYELPIEVSSSDIQNVTGIGGESGVDVKVKGGQVVVAPSWHNGHDIPGGGKRYAWTRSGVISRLPMSWALELVKREIPKWIHEYTPQTIREDSKAKKRAQKYLERAVISDASALSLCGSGTRNSTLYKRAVALFSLCAGLYLGSQWSYVQSELFRAAKAAGLSESEVRRTLNSAERFVRESGAVRVPVVLADPSTDSHASLPVDSQTHPSTQPGDDPFANIPIQDDKGAPAKMAGNVALLLAMHPVWRGGPSFDSYSQVEIWPEPIPEPIANIHRCEREIVDADHAAVQAWLMSLPVQYRVRAGMDGVTAGIHLASARRSVDLLRQWVDVLPEWDRVPRLKTWTHKYLGMKNDTYGQITGQAWLVAALERAIKPGIVVDTIPVLEGPQRSGKNLSLSTLFAGGPPWAPFLNNIAGHKLDDPNTLRLACTRWVLHDDELQARDPKRVDALEILGQPDPRNVPLTICQGNRSGPTSGVADHQHQPGQVPARRNGEPSLVALGDGEDSDRCSGQGQAPAPL